MPREKGNNDDFKSWLCESVLALCRGGLSYREDFSIEGVLGITIDHSDVFLVRIHNQDTVSVMKSEKAVQVSLEDHRTTYLQSDRASLHVSDLFNKSSFKSSECCTYFLRLISHKTQTYLVSTTTC